MNRRLGVVLILATGVAVGAVREFLFINLNYQIDFLRHHRRVSYAHSMFQQWVAGWDLATLERLKWSLALVLIGVMFTLCVLLGRLLAGTHRYVPALVVAFVGAATTALLLHLGASFTGLRALDAVGVKLLHALQYPIILFFLWGASVLAGRTSTQ